MRARIPLNLPILFFSLWFSLFACATVPSPPPRSGYGVSLRLPPAYLEVTAAGERLHDSQSLLQRANLAYTQGEWEKALRDYNLIIENEPEKELVLVALFNAGLTSLHLENPEGARRYFLLLVEKDPRHPLAQRALKNLLDLSEAEGKWEEATRHLHALAGFGEAALSPFEQAVHAAIIGANQTPDAFTPLTLETLAYEFRNRLGAGETLSRSLYARLYYSIGELYLYGAQREAMDPDLEFARLSELLEAKAEKLLKAQEAYLQSIRALDPFWATASAFRIGYSYESFYRELVESEPPRSLTTPEERALYEEEVLKLLEPLRNKAILAYEELLRFSEKYAYKTPWVSQAEEHLKRLKNGVKKPRG